MPTSEYLDTITIKKSMNSLLLMYVKATNYKPLNSAVFTQLGKYVSKQGDYGIGAVMQNKFYSLAATFVITHLPKPGPTLSDFAGGQTANDELLRCCLLLLAAISARQQRLRERLTPCGEKGAGPRETAAAATAAAAAAATATAMPNNYSLRQSGNREERGGRKRKEGLHWRKQTVFSSPPSSGTAYSCFCSSYLLRKYKYFNFPGRKYRRCLLLQNLSIMNTRLFQS